MSTDCWNVGTEKSLVLTESSIDGCDALCFAKRFWFPVSILHLPMVKATGR
jgi:hypothetical protein